MNTIKFNKQNVKMVAHRGLSGIETMNTCASFLAAANRSYFGIETDVHKTADGKFVLIHDDDTKRVCETVLNVEETDFDTLRSLTLFDSKKQTKSYLKIPTISEYLDICATYDKTAVLELKSKFTKEEIAQILEIAKEHISDDKIVYISFVYENLCFVRELSQIATCQFLCGYKEKVEINEEFIQKLTKYNFDLDIEKSALSKENVDLLHQNGIKVNCWTVDDKEKAEQLVNMGVDFITTNILE